MRNTQRDVVSGSLLIGASVAGMLVMSLHPTARDIITAENFPRLAQLNVMVHGMALVAVPVLFLGLLGLARRLGPSELTTAGLVAYGFGGGALISAAVASGFVAPAVIERMLAAEGESRGVYEALLAYTGLVNQGFAKVDVVASSAAILLWSAAILTSGRMARAAGVAGAVVGAGVLLAFLSGQLRLDVHGFGIVTFAQSGWLIWLGILLCRDGGRRIGHGSATPEG
jgi:hypothetical protein